MKNSFIMGIVWVSVIALVVSFGFTIFFLEGYAFEKKESSLVENEMKSVELLYDTDESSIRTNNFARIEENNMFQENKKNITEPKQAIEKNIESGEIIESISKIQSFIKPIQGEVVKSISTEALIYSKTLDEWIIHNGVDYKAKLGQEIFAIANGKVKEISFDYKYGNYIVIEHDNNYESLYANITVLDAINVGDKVEKGQIIGYLAESFGFEAADETHLHFELKNDEKYMEIIL